MLTAIKIEFEWLYSLATVEFPLNTTSADFAAIGRRKENIVYAILQLRQTRDSDLH